MEVTVTIEGGAAGELELEMLEVFSGPAIVEAVAAAAYGRWIELASERLGTSKAAYIEGIIPPQITGEDTAVIALEGAFPNMVESGAPGYDFRQTHLKGRAYMVIPFPEARSVTVQPAGPGRAPRVAIGGERSTRFRTLSQKSPPGTWMYPGLAPRNLMEQVVSELDEIASDVVQKTADALTSRGG